MTDTPQPQPETMRERLDNWKPIFVNQVIPAEFVNALEAELAAATEQTNLNESEM